MARYRNITFMSNNLPAVADNYLVQLKTKPETVATSTAWLTSLQMLPQRFLCISLYFYEKIDSF